MDERELSLGNCKRSIMRERFQEWEDESCKGLVLALRNESLSKGPCES